MSHSTTNYICKTCGVQYDESINEPSKCSICEEERQYVNAKGQDWTTLSRLISSGIYKNVLKDEENNVLSIKTVPNFGIGQTAYLVKDNHFNLLWDCITFLDKDTIQTIKKEGGIAAIALSHPHYYSSQVEWAETFDCPIYIHEDDREWVTRSSEKIRYWSGETLQLTNNLVLQRIGGHFKGGTILEWKKGADGKGLLLTGDIIRIVADQNWVSLMYSYPNLIPLPIKTVKRIHKRINELQYERLYDAFNRVIKSDAKNQVNLSITRYLSALEGTWFNT
ncbi:hypothetical protein [Shouchella miscanthi]|uniref:hypothetical protein n=1 Tax=Shouchella miscanthi TaxID=2598861 RepID=UPI0011A06A0C|nr:hypothetical protein [Shouchella miscanthi]